MSTDGTNFRTYDTTDKPRLCYFQGLGFSLSLTMISSNIAGTTKKQLTGAILFTGYCGGNIIGPQTFRDNEAPYYHSAYIA